MKGTICSEAFLRSGRKWEIHSVYRHTVNIRADGMLLAVHPDRILLTPLSLAVPLNEREFEQFAEKAECGRGLFIHLNEKEGSGACSICAGGSVWRTGVWESWNPRISLRLFPDHLRILGKETEKFLRERGREKGGLGNAAARPEPQLSDDLLTAVLRGHVREILRCGLSDMEGLKESAAAMLGLGVGLTPSGDDFLTGLLLAFFTGLPRDMEAVLEELKGKIKNSVFRTNDISRQYLLCACRGKYGMQLHELIAAGTEQAEIRRALEKAAEIGHSSGVDTLNGLLAGIKIILEALEGSTRGKEESDQ